MTKRSLAAHLRAIAAEVEAAEHAESARNERPNARKLTPSEVRQLRQEHASGLMNQRELAETYELNPATVSRIVRGIYHSTVR